MVCNSAPPFAPFVPCLYKQGTKQLHLVIWYHFDSRSEATLTDKKFGTMVGSKMVPSWQSGPKIVSH